MTALHMQLRTTPQHASCRPAVTDPAGHADAAAGPDDYFTLVAGVCAQALRDRRGYLELIEAINRIDASPGYQAFSRSAGRRPLR